MFVLFASFDVVNKKETHTMMRVTNHHKTAAPSPNERELAGESSNNAFRTWFLTPYGSRPPSLFCVLCSLLYTHLNISTYNNESSAVPNRRGLVVP